MREFRRPGAVQQATGRNGVDVTRRGECHDIGAESVDNGALWLVPKSHSATFTSDRFDEAKFFRSDLEENHAWIRTAVSPELNAGDVVFFHCNTLHSAGKNLSDQVKFSLVFTYHGASNVPLPGSRSAAKPEIAF